MRIETNHDFERDVIQNVITQVTEQVHINKGDPKEMILVVVNTKVNVSFGGDYDKPAAVVQLLSLTMSAEVTKKLTESISDILLERFSVPANRMYIFFQEFTQMHLVGWNRKIFSEILGVERLDSPELAQKRAEAQQKNPSK
ncbi:phenylpyruvate tautomerase MIF-related protein [Microcystis aeruginosa]|uniref:phenylpyruvate tautomerase MIF-related protein n=1 Tax=Microcystis aeruginosa TaxID=1126 RepID=UPI001912FDDE|nr:phenylpyruvate tautomerase MIF-related protein [Microcystis aeruginosa]